MYATCVVTPGDQEDVDCCEIGVIAAMSGSVWKPEKNIRSFGLDASALHH